MYDLSLPNTQIDRLLDLARNDFGPWLFDVDPDWSWNWLHLLYMRWHTRRMTDRQINRLML